MPRTLRVPLPEGTRSFDGWHEINVSIRNDEAYRRAWFADFRARWQRDLRQARVFTHQHPEMACD